jgi:hypothetical protein
VLLSEIWYWYHWWWPIRSNDDRWSS